MPLIVNQSVQSNMASTDNTSRPTKVLSFETVTTEETAGNAQGFVNAVTVWINKPHVVNRRLCGTRINYFETLPPHAFDGYNVNKILVSTGFTLASQIPITETACIHNASNVQKLDAADEISGLDRLREGEVAVIIREMIPKQPERHKNIPELIIYVQSEKSFSFYPLLPSCDGDGTCLEVAYKLSYCADAKPRVQLSTDSSDLSCDSQRQLSQTWLQSQLVRKLARWSEEPQLKTSLTSLKLLPLEEYSRLYSEMKNKYGLHFAKVWPEKTDPQKYVFEDVAIATYLLLLWKQDRERKGFKDKQSFVDLGCGNGLLVHILASEGHPGYGIDVRRRNIWDMYGPETILKEAAITPSSESLFPESDWLIGNHSDELTPWIPVMAARTSFNCCYFVLPCCHYDFNCKFRHDGAGSKGVGKVEEGQYRNYLNFVATVGETCGFTVEEDMLRIPSTKRICFIGRNRTYNAEQESQMDEVRQAFIHSRCDKTDSTVTNGNKDAAGGESSNWAPDFTPRDKVEVSRNCVTVSPETKETVIQTVFKNVLDAKPCDCPIGQDGKPWRRGGSIAIGDVAKMFDKSLLLELKSECGGLQTLMRNSSHIFQVSSGQVRLRDFTQDDPFEGRKAKGKPGDKRGFYKTATCWFHVHHPDGCPRAADTCQYAHGEHELRERPKKVKS